MKMVKFKVAVYWIKTSPISSFGLKYLYWLSLSKFIEVEPWLGIFCFIVCFWWWSTTYPSHNDMIKERKMIANLCLCVFSFFLSQVIAHHPMQSISFASGGDTVSAVYYSPLSSVLLEWTFWQTAHLTRLHLTGFQSHDQRINEALI